MKTVFRVSIAELQTHAELDPDPSSEFTVEEARVRCRKKKSESN